MKTMLDDKLQKISLNEKKPKFPAPASTTTFKQATSSSHISSVDEFCPEDGNRLDTSFLDDLQDGNNPSSRMTTGLGATAQDSDSDNETQGNPLVARYDEDYVDTIEKSSPLKTFPDASKQKVNPLSKHRDRNSSDIEVFNIMDANRSRRSSSSSLEIKIDRNENSSYVEFDSDSSKFLDSKVRRSPEGIEDTTTDTPAMCSNPSYHIDRAYPVQAVNDSESDEKEKEKKKKHKKKSKEPKSERKSKEKKSKKKKSKDVSTSDDETVNVAKDAYEMI